MKVDIGIPVDLEILIETRLLAQANSGGGKSYLIRKILEATHGKVQQIVLDLEGEFSSLREKFDFIVFGEQGDYPVNIRYAEKTARTLLELNVSAIIDLYELKHHERITFVKRFLDSMINAPKNLWHSCLVIVDEAHVFCPEKGQSEAMGSVIDLCTRGRKRGYCAVLATQRLSKLHKDAAAECNNKLIGRTGLDIDMKRAGEELGFTSKQDILSLRNLSPGEFYAFGPAISNKIELIKIGKVITSHPKTGARLVAIPPASDKVKKALSRIKELPEEAEKELKTLDDYRKEINSLRGKLRFAEKQQPVIKSDDGKLKDEISGLKIKLISKEKEILYWSKNIDRIKTTYEGFIMKYKDALKKVGESIDQLLKMGVQLNLPKPEEIKIQDVSIKHQPIIKQDKQQTKYYPRETLQNYKSANNDGETKLREGARRMLAALVQWFPNGMTEGQMRSHAGLKNSGTYSAYKTDLKRAGFLDVRSDGLFYATESAIDWLGHDIPSPATTEDVLNVWNPKLRLGARRMLEVLIRYNGEFISDEQLQQESELANSGTYSAYKTELKTAQLAIIKQGMIAANKETLFL